MPPKKATTETKGNAKPKAKAPGRTRRSTIGIATLVQIPKILEQWVLHLTEACEIAPAGRGSRSGANRCVRWESCEACGLRLSYTPASCMGLTRSDPSSGTTPSGHRGPDQREEAREQEHRAGGQEDRLFHAQQPSLQGEPAEGRAQEGRVGQALDRQGRPEQGLSRAEVRRQVDRGREPVPRFYGPSSAGIRFSAFGSYVKPILSADDTGGARRLQEAAGGGDDSGAGQKSQEKQRSQQRIWSTLRGLTADQEGWTHDAGWQEPGDEL